MKWHIVATALLAVMVSGCFDANKPTIEPDEADEPAAAPDPAPPVTVEYPCGTTCWAPFPVPGTTVYDVAVNGHNPNQVAIATRGTIAPAGSGTVNPQYVPLVALSLDGGDTWEGYMLPQEVNPLGYGIATSVAFDMLGRLHVMADYSGTIIGGNIIEVGTPVQSEIRYARMDVASGAWDRNEPVAADQRVGIVRAHEDRLFMTTNEGITLYTYEMPLDWQELPEPVTVNDCWYPIRPHFDGDAWLSCDSENRAFGEGSTWWRIANGTATKLFTSSCLLGEPWNNSILLSNCGGPPTLVTWNGTISTTPVKTLGQLITSAEFDEEGRAHVVSIRLGDSESAADDYRNTWFHEVVHPDGSTSHAGVITERVIWTDMEADAPHSGYPRNLFVTQGKGLFLSSPDLHEGMMQRSFTYS